MKLRTFNRNIIDFRYSFLGSVYCSTDGRDRWTSTFFDLERNFKQFSLLREKTDLLIILTSWGKRWRTATPQKRNMNRRWLISLIITALMHTDLLSTWTILKLTRKNNFSSVVPGALKKIQCLLEWYYVRFPICGEVCERWGLKILFSKGNNFSRCFQLRPGKTPTLTACNFAIQVSNWSHRPSPVSMDRYLSVLMRVIIASWLRVGSANAQ